uniref:Uncharacterized protein n=1 Tax=Alexandrium catenella TaxID=2925 RepID=A0A7S1QSB7_ALECA|mmetsp:Transcript_37682/g.101970  ORF Transcript_37682/g.101970 Transcript_37682/m.101970 type:complete len:235 (+) Transcript_37682:93-797(+)
MRWLFSGCMAVEKPREAELRFSPETNPDIHVAAQKVDMQVATLERRIAECEEEIRDLVGLGAGNTAARQRALQAVKRKKMYEQQRDQLLGTQFNLETLAFQHDQAEITLAAVNAMKHGHMQLKQQTEGLDAGQVEVLRADMEDLAEDMKAINEVLSGAPDCAEEDDLAAEYAKVEEELAAEALAAKHRASARDSGGAGGSRRAADAAGASASGSQRQSSAAARARPERVPRYVA